MTYVQFLLFLFNFVQCLIHRVRDPIKQSYCCSSFCVALIRNGITGNTWIEGRPHSYHHHKVRVGIAARKEVIFSIPRKLSHNGFQSCVRMWGARTYSWILFVWGSFKPSMKCTFALFNLIASCVGCIKVTCVCALRNYNTPKHAMA